MSSSNKRNLNRSRRGFTLVELLVAGVITAFVLGSLGLGVSNLSRAKETAKLRFDAHIRADAALNIIRREIASVNRRDDMFWTRLLILNDENSIRHRDDYFERDGILVFNTRLRAVRDIDFSGEGFEYETQLRVSEDEVGPVLWVRHDGVPDEYPLGGGKVTPAVEGILMLKFEAYDGYGWYEEWDSDIEGLPLAVRITVMACGHRNADDVFLTPRATLRTVVPIDRVIPPKDLFQDAEEEDEEAAPEEGEAGEEGGDPTGGGGGGGGGRVPVGGGGAGVGGGGTRDGRDGRTGGQTRP